MSHSISVPGSTSYSESFENLDPASVIRRLRNEAQSTLQKICASAQKPKYINYDSTNPKTLRKVSLIRHGSLYEKCMAIFTKTPILYGVGGMIISIIPNWQKLSLNPDFLIPSILQTIFIVGLGSAFDRLLPLTWSFRKLSLFGNELLVKSQNEISSIASKAFNYIERSVLGGGASATVKYNGLIIFFLQLTVFFNLKKRN